MIRFLWEPLLQSSTYHPLFHSSSSSAPFFFQRRTHDFSKQRRIYVGMQNHAHNEDVSCGRRVILFVGISVLPFSNLKSKAAENLAPDELNYGKNIVAELESASQLRVAGFFLTRRPWLDLYGVNVRPVAPFGSTCSKPVIDSSLIHRCLPDELLFEVLPEIGYQLLTIFSTTLGLEEEESGEWKSRLRTRGRKEVKPAAKRPAESAQKTPIPAKKGKNNTPQKSVTIKSLGDGGFCFHRT